MSDSVRRDPELLAIEIAQLRARCAGLMVENAGLRKWAQAVTQENDELRKQVRTDPPEQT